MCIETVNKVNGLGGRQSELFREKKMYLSFIEANHVAHQGMAYIYSIYSPESHRCARLSQCAQQSPQAIHGHPTPEVTSIYPVLCRVNAR